MFKKFKFVPILATLLLVLFLTACNSNDTTEPVKEAEEPATEGTEHAAEEPKLEGELIISAAASLTDAAEELKSTFNKVNPNVTITYNFGGSGALATQIQEGAPADIFMSASQKDMDTVEDLGLLLDDSRFDFASNAIVLVTKKSNDITLEKLEDIATLDISHIAMGDPESVPAGRYGKAAFEAVGVWDKIESKMVYVSDVRQALTQVETGNADLGIAFSTDAKTSDTVKAVINIDPSLHDAIIYPAAIVKSSENAEVAKAYLDFLNSDEGKTILESYGFITK
ncbi:molybdate ABC transporter substrate-binding protein [Cytobacillus praedii]|uniref:molybdate ABC transporter substrate-binding protein n=1 Tax=Cytobacillus praedii TaxID=1742358 RepID=UPI003F7ECE8F